MFELPLPPVIEDGLKLMFVLLAVVDADKEIEVTFPEITAVVMVTLADDPLDTVMADELEETLNTTGVAVMVMLTVAVAVVLAASVPVPVTVTLKVPVGAVDRAVNCRLDVPDGLICAGVKTALTPEGNPDIVRFTLEL